MARRTSTTTTNAVIYSRVSTQDQADNGVGLDTQEDRCRAVCAARGLNIVAEFSDKGLSGKLDVCRRPGLAAALAAARTQNAILVVYSVSRVARSQRILWNLIDPGKNESVALISATEPFDTSTPMGRAMLGMIGVWAQLEADLVSERTRDALAQVRASGKKLGAPTMTTVAPEAVARIHALRAEGLSLRAIVERLNEEAVPGARGGRWWVKTVRSAIAQSPIEGAVDAQ